MKVPFVDIQTQYQSIKTQIDTVISNVLNNSDFILGQAVENFEEAFARYCETTCAVGVDSGFSALELILRAYSIGPGDEVLTAANTFIATALSISTCGARPVFVDVDPQTYNLDPARLEEAITPATKAVIPVHLYGQPADMDPILEIAHRYNLKVIEDACQAHGARYKGKRTGALGDAAAFSLYPTKNLGAYGDGGVVVTGDALLAERIRLLRNLGQESKNCHQIKGYNRRLDSLQAAIIGAKLPFLDQWNAERRRAAACYDELLADMPVSTPITAPWAEHVYHLYVIQVEERDALQANLAKAGISTAVHYPVPIHLQPAFQELGYRQGDFPVAEELAGQILSLPMYPELEQKTINQITRSLEGFFKQPAIASFSVRRELGN